MKKRLSKLIARIIFTISEKWYNKILLKRAIRGAKTKWLKSGKQHFVLFTNNQYVIINKAFLREFNKKRKSQITHRQLMDMSVYVTPASGYTNI